MIKTRIGVVRGGPSNEYDISLKTGAAVLKSLDREKYEPVDILVTKDGAWHMNGVEIQPNDALKKVDVIFNALHGHYGEDGKIQQMLEAHNKPFTGSGSIASAVTMAKHLAKEAFRRVGLKTPAHIVVEKDADATKAYLLAHSKFALPYVLKPVSGGSSLGVVLVKKRDDFADALYKALEKGDSVLIEEFIPGTEATVGVIRGFRGQGMYALPPIEIRTPEDRLFDFGSKYGGGAKEIVPATFPLAIKKELERMAVDAHEALGLSQYSRSDFIVSPRRGIYILETNSLPGLTEESLVPKALKSVGASLSDLADHLIKLALDR